MFNMRSKYFLNCALIMAALFCSNCMWKEDEPKGGTASSRAVERSSPEVAPGEAASPVVVTTTIPAIAVADGETAGTKVEVQELKRSGNSLMLKISMINDSEKPLSFNYNFGDQDNSVKDFNTIGGVTLVDAAGKKKYFVVRDTENTCVCSSNIKDLAPKSRANLWAKFPAPPDEVQKISVIIPHFTPMDDVPISH